MRRLHVLQSESGRNREIRCYAMLAVVLMTIIVLKITMIILYIIYSALHIMAFFSVMKKKINIKKKLKVKYKH